MKLLAVLVVGCSLAAAAASASAAAKVDSEPSAVGGAERKSRFLFLGKLLAGGAAAVSKTFGLTFGGAKEPQPAKQILLLQTQPQQTSYPHPHPPPKRRQACPIPLFPGGCSSGQVCAMVAFGQHQCVPQRADGASCVTNFECLSGTCRSKHCVTDECRNAGQQSSCPKGQECVDSDSGNKCKVSGASNECPMALSMQGCSEMQYCTVGSKGNVCTTKRPVNSACSERVQCLSGSCRHGKCKNDACPMVDSSIDCMPSQYCTSSNEGNMCVPRKENGARCSGGAHCQSAVCEHGVCVQDDCWKPFTQDRCQPTHFCSPGQKGNTCTAKKALGSSCRMSVECQWHVCRDNTCVKDQCPTPLTTDRCDMNTQFCMSGDTGNRCVTKLDDHMSCKVMAQCMSNNCVMGTCLPKGPVKLGIGKSCSLSRECESYLCVVGKCANAKMSLGGRCYLPSDCQSEICRHYVCAGPPTTAKPMTTTTKMTTPMPAETTTPTTEAPLKEVGGSCNMPHECRTGFCVGSLCTTGDIGAQCAIITDCKSMFCGDNMVCSLPPMMTTTTSATVMTTATTPMALSTIGEACMMAATCESNNCVAMACVLGTVAGNMPCTFGSQCASSACLPSGLCFAQPLAGENEPCTMGPECMSTFCGIDTCTTGAVMSPCNDPADCDSMFCVDDMCTDGVLGSACVENTDCTSMFCGIDTCISGAAGQPCNDDADCMGTCPIPVLATDPQVCV